MYRKKRPIGSPLTGQSTTDSSTNRIAFYAARIVASRAFDWTITGIILLQAVTLAIESTPGILPNDKQGKSVMTGIFAFIQSLVIDIFIVEAGLRLIALYPKPQRYFKDPWNCFDFTIIVLSFLPTTGQFSTIARLVRLVRILRLVTKSTELRAIVSTLARSVPSILNILILLGILFFIYAIVGYHLFRHIDPGHWSSFLTSLTTLFQIITLEEWVAIMNPIVENLGPLYWLYFASFIIIGTFIIINLFISVIVRKSEEAYQQVQRESEIPLTQQEIMHEIREIRRILEDIENRFEENKGSES